MAGVASATMASADGAVDDIRVPTATGYLIIDAALDRFAEIGYDGTSMRELARSVGVKPASLYNHFESKEALLWAIVKDAMADLVARQAAVLPAADTIEERFRAFVRAHIEFHASRSRQARVVNRQLQSLSRQHYDETVAQRRQYANRLRTLIEEGLAEGIFDVPNVMTATYAVLQMGMGVSNWFNVDGDITVDELVRHYEIMGCRLVGLSDARRR